MLREGHAVTGGNPLLLSELARTLELEGAGPDGTSTAGDIAALGSRAVARTVDVRLTRAGDDARKLAEAAAVVGEDARLIRAVELAGLEPEPADRAALELVRLEVLKPGSPFSSSIRSSALRSTTALAAPERVRLHRKQSRS